MKMNQTKPNRHSIFDVLLALFLLLLALPAPVQAQFAYTTANVRFLRPKGPSSLSPGQRPGYRCSHGQRPVGSRFDWPDIPFIAPR